MSNYEKIASSPESLALWLRGGRLNCELCPCEYGCTETCLFGEVGCYDVLLEWLNREAESDEV